MAKDKTSPADYIVPLNINGMEGRMLSMPAPKNRKREILFIYGHHSSLERWWGVMQVLNRYGAITMPDLPGFGGMDSFYSIGKKPTLDNLADYLAAFIKLRYNRKKITIVGMSFGFVIATRMLQMYPEQTNKVTTLVSLVGFSHHDDLTFSKTRFLQYNLLSKTFKHRPFNYFFRYVCLNSHVLRAVYARTNNAKHKFAQAEDEADFKRLMDVEVGLWQSNDVRTYMYTTQIMLKLDNCGVRVDLPVWHVRSVSDHFFDNYLVEQHLRIIFKDFHSAEIDLGAHAPSVIADEATAAPLIPPKIRRLLLRKS